MLSGELIKAHWASCLLLLKNGWINFDQIWGEASLGKGSSDKGTGSPGGPKRTKKGGNFQILKTLLVNYKWQI